MSHTPSKRAPRARRRLRDRALVLRRYPFRESSLVCHLLTPEHGRVAILAKGAYRPRSAYSGVLDLFDTLELDWGRGSDLGLLHAGRILVRRGHIPRDLDRYRAGARVLELLGLAARPEHEETELFAEATGVLDLLEAGTSSPALVSVLFDLRFLHVLGQAPALERCAQCGRDLRRATGTLAAFATPLGGRLCDPCARGARGVPGPRIEDVPLGLLRIAASLLSTPWTTVPRVQLTAEQTAKLTAIVRPFLEYHLGTRPRAAGPPPRTTVAAART